MSLAPPRMALFGRRLGSLVLSAGLTAGVLAGLAGAPVSASSVCDPGGDTCVVYPDAVQTPLGIVTVTTSATNVVTVHLAPSTPNTLALGIPFSIPPGPPCRIACARTTIDTPGGLVAIDTFQFLPGRLGSSTLPSLAIISIHPPGPCRATTTGTTVVFTPIYPPGPPA